MQSHATNNIDNDFRTAIRDAYISDETKAIKDLINYLNFNSDIRNRISQDAVTIVNELRLSKSLGLMETFLAEYGLSTQEGVSLMCLAEALLRVPDESPLMP